MGFLTNPQAKNKRRTSEAKIDVREKVFTSSSTFIITVCAGREEEQRSCPKHQRPWSADAHKQISQDDERVNAAVPTATSV